MARISTLPGNRATSSHRLSGFNTNINSILPVYTPPIALDHLTTDPIRLLVDKTNKVAGSVYRDTRYTKIKTGSATPLPWFRLIAATLICLHLVLFPFGDQQVNARQISDAIKQVNVSFGTPEAAQFSRYGNMDVSLFKGVPNVTVPLHEFSLKDFSLPIYLSYNAGGIKVDEIAGNAGLGWTLFAGGQINQFVQGVNDLETEKAAVISTLADFQGFDPNIWNGVSQVGLEDYDFAWSMFDPSFVGELKNLKPDIFYYSYGTTSGRFIGGGETMSLATIYSIPYHNHTIFFDHENHTFEITDEHGNLYIFDQRETTTTAKDIHKCKGGLGTQPLSTDIKTVDFTTSYDWKLGKIITANQDTHRLCPITRGCQVPEIAVRMPAKSVPGR